VKLLVLSGPEVHGLLPPGECADAMRGALAARARGEVHQPLRTVFSLGGTTPLQPPAAEQKAPRAPIALGGTTPLQPPAAERAPRIVSVEDLHAERFRGIRPAFGYPACPDHSEKTKLVDLLDAGRLGIGLTESFAMTPAASVSGLILAHPRSRYFAVGRIGRDQVEDYAARKQVPVAEAERWLRPNLAYDPAPAR
jgi:Vitamin B12 dependent methionine synthase, activation domain